MHKANNEQLQLPVVNSGPRIRPSRAGWWRAGVLLGVHAIAALHIAHYMSSGRTLAPLEPSEAMEFFKASVINAGFVFFGLTIVSTAVFGRFFCGWACHIVALQDLCRLILAKLGLRPKPLRSRVLMIVPLVASLYMFIYPLVYRINRGLDPERIAHEPMRAIGDVEFALTTDAFWATFPGWFMTALTFLCCGFVVVYFLGAKAFCAYGCPYGAAYGVADQLATMRIRVTDACAGCGHCTAVCTSNVRVHAEVRDYGMVVDPGCMKCMDCVSVCPNDALYVGRGTPALFARLRSGVKLAARTAELKWWALNGVFAFALFMTFTMTEAVTPWLHGLGAAISTLVVMAVFRSKSRRERADYTIFEEAALAACLIFTLVVCRGFYVAVPGLSWNDNGEVPFLFALGLAAILAFLLVQGLRLVTRPNLALHGWCLKRAGRLSAYGWLFAVVMLGLSAGLVRGAVIQGHARAALRAYEATAAQRRTWFDDRRAPLDAETAALVEAGARHAAALPAWARSGNPKRDQPYAWLHLMDGQGEVFEQAASAMLEAVYLPQLHVDLGNYLAAAGRFDEALAQYRLGQAAGRGPGAAWVRQARVLGKHGNFVAAERLLRDALALGHDHAEAHYTLGIVLAALGRSQEAVVAFQRAVELSPMFIPAQENLAVMLLQLRRYREALAAFETAIELSPSDPDNYLLRADVHVALGDRASAGHNLQAAANIYEQRIGQGPGEVDDYVQLCRIRMLSAQWAEAEAAIGRLQQAHPQAGEVVVQLQRQLDAARSPRGQSGGS